MALSGRAVSESAVLDVLDRLKANPRLSEVKLVSLGRAGRQPRDVAFTMSFTFTQAEGIWPSPSARKPSSRSQ